MINDVDVINTIITEHSTDNNGRKQFIDTIFRDPEEVLFVVSHGTTIRTIILNWFHYAPEWFNSEKLMNNCAVRLITKENNVSTEEYIYGGVNK